MAHLWAGLLIGNATIGQVTVDGSFLHDGITRTYSYHVPASYVPGQAVPLVLGLHGLGSSGDEFAEYRDFRPIADTAGFIMAHPDGSTLLGGIRFWNYDNVLGSTVDDVGFLEALIDTIAAHYTVDPLRVYATGMSNGSFMCYALACRSDRFAAVGGVTGSMSTGMHDSCSPSYPTPVIHIHGTDDGTNPYAGTSTMVGIEDLVAFWLDRNGCDSTPTVTPVPDLDPGDGAAAEHHLYTGGTDGHTVELFKVIGGGHTWPGSPMPGTSGNTCMDFDARLEIWRFFSQHQRTTSSSVQEQREDEFALWSDPVDGTLHIHSGDDPVTGVLIMDAMGRTILEHRAAGIQRIDLGHLPTGTYLVGITRKGSYVARKLLIQ